MASRLSSLDALRGLTLFFLVGLGPVITTFCEGVPDAASNGFISTLAMKHLGIFIRL